jgi:hypothetical protein
MTIDIFNRVVVDLTLSVPPVSELSVNNTAMVTNKTLPGSVLYKLYQDVADFIVDFPSDTAPEEFTWGTAFYAANPNGVLFAIHTVTPTTDAGTEVSTAILNALQAIQENAEIGAPESFYTVSISNGDEIFYSDAQVVAELTNLAASGKKLFFIGQTYSTTMFNSLNTWAPAVYLQNTALASLGVMMIGYPNLEINPVVPKASAGAAGFFSQVSLDNGVQQDSDGQTFPNVTPLKVGSTDTYGTLFDNTKVNELVNAQVNMYTRFKNQTQFALGLAMAPVFIPALYYYIRELLEEYLQNELNPLFFTGALPYNNATITRVHALISDSLDKFVKAGMINPGFTITDPVLDYTTPIPRKLNWVISGELQGRVYSITVGGNLQG